MINWEMITEGYNLTHKCKFSTTELFNYLYHNMGSTKKIADYLGVSYNTVLHKMDKLNIPRIRYTPRSDSIQRKIAGIPTSKLVKMTSKQISVYVGCRHGSIYHALDMDGRKYKKRCKLNVSIKKSER